MSEAPMDTLLAVLTRIRRRLVCVRAVEAGLAGALAAAAGGLVVAGLRIFAPRLLPVFLAHPAAPLALLPCGFVTTFLVRCVVGASLHAAARAADRAAGLDERLATALEVMQAPPSRQPSPREDVSGGSRWPGPGNTAVRAPAGAWLAPFLLADARRAAAGLDPRGLRLSRTLGRRGRAALVATVILAALALVPSLAGPTLDRADADRAARALETFAERPAVAPAVRNAARRAAAGLREPGVRRSEAEDRLRRVARRMVRAMEARRGVAETLAASGTRQLRDLVQAARSGDAESAGVAAEELADRLSRDAASGGMPPAERERLADTLDAAVPRAREAGLANLDRALADAATALRAADARAAAAAERLAEAMVGALGPGTASADRNAVETLEEAVRAAGLPVETHRGRLVAASPDGSVETRGPAAETARGETALRPKGGTATGRPVDAVPDEVRPEDRDVVRRYFGG